MAQTKNNPGLQRKSWFGRHKVLTGFLVLLLAGVLWYVVTTVIWELQVHAERQRFVAADQQVQALSGPLSKIGNPKVTVEHSCSYTSFGAFTNKSLGCQIDLQSSYTSLSKDEAEQYTQQALALLKSSGYQVKENPGGYSKNDLAVYVFDVHGIGCAFASTYYDQAVPVEDRYSQANSSGNAGLFHIGCSGPAKAAYFPVVSD